MTAHIVIIRSDADLTKLLLRLQNSPLLDKAGKRLVVAVSREKKRRTLKQNSFMHMLWDYFDQIAGWGDGEAKEYFKEQYGPVVSRRLGNELRRIPLPSSQYSTRQAEAMIDTVYRIAAENGFALPSPHDEESWGLFRAQLEAA